MGGSSQAIFRTEAPVQCDSGTALTLAAASCKSLHCSHLSLSPYMGRGERISGMTSCGSRAGRGGCGSVEVVPRLRGLTPLLPRRKYATPLREALTGRVALARNAITKEPARSILAWSAKNTKGGMHFYTNVAEEDGSYACADVDPKAVCGLPESHRCPTLVSGLPPLRMNFVT